MTASQMAGIVELIGWIVMAVMVGLTMVASDDDDCDGRDDE